MSGVQSYFENLFLARTSQFDVVLVVCRLGFDFNALDVTMAFRLARRIHVLACFALSWASLTGCYVEECGLVAVK